MGAAGWLGSRASKCVKLGGENRAVGSGVRGWGSVSARREREGAVGGR